MTSKEIIERLANKGVKPTVNRILVYQALVDLARPVSLRELEIEMPNLDRSSIFRVLTLFEQQDVVHTFEDGRGILKYERCQHHDGECHHAGGHLHFYCENCQQTYCMEEIQLPEIALPEDYHPHSISFVIKGICPRCAKK